MKFSLVFASLLFGCSTQAQKVPFDPDMLNYTVIERVEKREKLWLLGMTKNGIEYRVVVDDKRETQFVFMVLGTKKKPEFQLIWVNQNKWI